jgi:hypothetical protein
MKKIHNLEKINGGSNCTALLAMISGAAMIPGSGQLGGLISSYQSSCM